MKVTLAVSRTDKYLYADILRLKLSKLKHNLAVEPAVRTQVVGSIRLGVRNNLDLVPMTLYVLLPCSNLARKLVIIGHKLVGTL